MKTAIMQPYFFPYIGYFQLINHVDKFVILDDVQYIKSGWINRNYLLQKNKPLMFTIPVSVESSRSLINNVKVKYNTGRIIKLLKTIELNYSKSPFYKNVIPLIENIFEEKNELISDMALSSISTVIGYLSINTVIIESSSVFNNRHLKGEDRIIDICKLLGADKYFNLSGGQSIYSKDRFNKEGIELNFIKTREITYKQFTDYFTGPLSIIDNLMFNSPEDINKSLLEFEIL